MIKMEQPQTTISVPYSLLTLNEEAKTPFENIITQAIDDVLSAFGDVNKQAIYRHLEYRYGITREAIPFKIEDFATAIEKTFGSVAKLIEIKIIESLHAKCIDFSYFPEKGELDFIEFVYNLQNHVS
jgi:hypothetical protein